MYFTREVVTSHYFIFTSTMDDKKVDIKKKRDIFFFHFHCFFRNPIIGTSVLDIIYINSSLFSMWKQRNRNETSRERFFITTLLILLNYIVNCIRFLDNFMSIYVYIHDWQIRSIYAQSWIFHLPQRFWTWDLCNMTCLSLAYY